MGDIIQLFRVRSRPRGAGVPLRLYFDTGSPYTFVKQRVAGRLGNVARLEAPAPFGGLGNGRFQAKGVASLYICFLGVWCPHLAYVVPDAVLEPDYDILVGHDLMQRLNIRPLPREHRVLLDRASLRLSLRVR
jgi:hypothetical protein